MFLSILITLCQLKNKERDHVRCCREAIRFGEKKKKYFIHIQVVLEPFFCQFTGLLQTVIQSDLDNPAFFNPEPLISDSVL